MGSSENETVAFLCTIHDWGSIVYTGTKEEAVERAKSKAEMENSSHTVRPLDEETARLCRMGKALPRIMGMLSRLVDGRGDPEDIEEKALELYDDALSRDSR
jgi:hypothetical protein